jgi:uncharacterized membrane protein HdeD (DUF308 family)
LIPVIFGLVYKNYKMSFKTGNPDRLLIRGIVSIVLGLAVVAVPDLTLVTVIRFLGALMLIDGSVAILLNNFSKKKQSSVLQIIPRGMTNLIFGVVLLVFPSLVVNVFVFLIGFVLIIAGFTQLSSQIRGRSFLGTSWLMLLISFIAFVSGIVLVTKPFESAQTMLIVVGVIIALYGIGEIIFSFKIRKYQKHQPKAEPTIIDAEYEDIE